MNIDKVLKDIRESVGIQYDVGYHITPTENLTKIKSEGLVPKIGQASLELGETTERIYLFPTMDYVEDALTNWLGEFYEDHQLALLKVDLSDIPHSIDNKLEYEFYVDNPIPPNNIKVLTEDIDNYF